MDLVPRVAPRPLLLISAGRGVGGEPELNPEYVRAAGESGALWTIPEAEHMGGIRARPAEYERRVTAFFDDALAPVTCDRRRRSARGGAGAAPSPPKGTGMGDASSFEVVPIGHVESTLTDPAAAPEAGPRGRARGLARLRAGRRGRPRRAAPGDEVLVLTWLDRARRDVLRVHPRSDPTVPEQGVFTTRSPDRPNPIGLHPRGGPRRRGPRVRVGPLEALDGTPVLDVKPVLRAAEGRR